MMSQTFFIILAALIGLGLSVLPSAVMKSVYADDWPQWRGPNRDGVWRETGIIDRFDGPEIKLRWRAKISGGYSGPTVADGRVFVTDRVTEPEEQERVLAFDAQPERPLYVSSYPCRYQNVTSRTGPLTSVTLS